MELKYKKMSYDSIKNYEELTIIRTFINNAIDDYAKYQGEFSLSNMDISLEAIELRLKSLRKKIKDENKTH